MERRERRNECLHITLSGHRQQPTSDGKISAGCARHKVRRSPMAISQLSALGWKVVPKIGARLGTYP